MRLSDFLLARIADEEAVANLARPDDHLKTRDHSFLRVEKARGDTHVAATPARVLAECEAKRGIVERCDTYYGDDLIGVEVLRLLALPYVDHPDYQEGWRP